MKKEAMRLLEEDCVFCNEQFTAVVPSGFYNYGAGFLFSSIITVLSLVEKL